METNKDIEQLLLSIQKAFDVLEEKRTDLPILPFGTTLVRQPHYAGGRRADKLEEYTAVLGNRVSFIVLTDSVGNEPEGETAKFYVLKSKKYTTYKKR